MRPVLALAALAAALYVAGAGAAGRYTDPVGDNNGAPDIKRVVVTRDAAGQIRFTISFNGFKPKTTILVELDTDLNPKTGAPATEGADYEFVVDMDNLTFDFNRWDGTWSPAPGKTVKMTVLGGDVRISVNPSELGAPDQFNFWIRSLVDGGLTGKLDTAPDDGWWNYWIDGNGPDIRDVVAAKTRAPRAGARFTLTPVGVKVPGAPAGALPPPDSYHCRAAVARKGIVGAGTGRCSWSMPKNVRGKLLTIVLTVRYQGGAKAVRYWYRIR